MVDIGMLEFLYNDGVPYIPQLTVGSLIIVMARFKLNVEVPPRELQWLLEMTDEMADDSPDPSVISVLFSTTSAASISPIPPMVALPQN